MPKLSLVPLIQIPASVKSSAVLVPAAHTPLAFVLDASKLKESKFIFDIISGAAVAGALELEELSKPWWHSTNWFTAHPFSEQGKWIGKASAIQMGDVIRTRFGDGEVRSRVSGRETQ